ncbi:HAD hydrolase family protein [bacterium]|nr:HAD hydrolase family protein [bacterium]
MTRLYVSDLDGTLLDRHGLISDWSREALNRLIDGGLPFTVASARSVVSMREVLPGVRVRLPIIEFNGALVSELATGQHRHCASIPPAWARQIIAAGQQCGLPPVIATWDGTADHVYFLPPTNDGVQGYVTSRLSAGDPRLRPVTALDPALRERVVCLTFMDRIEVLERLHGELAATLGDAVRLLLFPEEYFPPWHWLAVYAAGATKAHALAVVAADLGIALEEVTVFGDQINDIPMFEECGHAVAVANAAPALLEHADEVIGPNGQDSVVRYLVDCWPPAGGDPGTGRAR